MTIAQISDPHISADLAPANGIDVCVNFERTLLHACADPDIEHIVISGDLCLKESSETALHWIKSRLDACGKPYYVISGNHDNSTDLARVFGMQAHLKDERMYYNVTFPDAGLQLIFLDTAPGDIDARQTAWFKETLSIPLPAIIFMHHPPLLAGVPHMDTRYAMLDKASFWESIVDFPHIRGIFCGHYHAERSLFHAGIPVFITPSTYFQLDDRTEVLGVIPYPLAWRKIVWEVDLLRTNLVFVPE